MAVGGLPINLAYFEAWNPFFVKGVVSGSLRVLEFWAGKPIRMVVTEFSCPPETNSGNGGIWKMPTMAVI